MAKIGDILKSDIAKGVGIGLAIGAVGVYLVPALRPVAKATIKSGILIFEKGRILVGEAMESLEDVIAEVQAELAEEELAIEPEDTALTEEEGIETPA